jgi:CubicO group peptidase (beta-lactamase class C family)
MSTTSALGVGSALWLMLCISMTAQAGIVITPEDMQPSAMSNVCTKVDCVDALPKFRKLIEIQPSSKPRELNKRTVLGFLERNFVQRANAIFDANPALAMIFIDKDEIIHERYHPAINEKTPLLSYSMSKSLTSMVVGKAHCAGDISNLDAKMKDVNSVLDGTVYGEATIRQILMMASGGIRGSVTSGGSPYKAALGNPYDPYIYWSTLNQLRKFKAHQQKPDGSLVKAGEEFSYKNLDTQSLIFLFPKDGERAFANIFEKEIWQAAGAENKGYWVHDKDGYIHTMSSFHATPRDWARVAMQILETVSSSRNDCYTNYLKAATSSQIENKSRNMPQENWIGRAFGGYGYQFWTQNESDSDAIYLNGALGQRIAISPKKQRIMIIFSYQESYMGELYKLFSGW